jgi:hypothetical protein
LIRHSFIRFENMTTVGSSTEKQLFDQIWTSLFATSASPFHVFNKVKEVQDELKQDEKIESYVRSIAGSFRLAFGHLRMGRGQSAVTAKIGNLFSPIAHTPTMTTGVQGEHSFDFFRAFVNAVEAALNRMTLSDANKAKKTTADAEVAKFKQGAAAAFFEQKVAPVFDGSSSSSSTASTSSSTRRSSIPRLSGSTIPAPYNFTSNLGTMPAAPSTLPRTSPYDEFVTPARKRTRRKAKRSE